MKSTSGVKAQRHKMQAQAQISGQLSDQAGGQLADLAQQNGSNLSSQTSNLGSIRRPWHADPD